MERAHLPNAADDFADQGEVGFGLLVFPTRIGRRPGGGDEKRRSADRRDEPAIRALFVQPLPEDFGDKGYEGVEKPQDVVEGQGQDGAGGGGRGLVLHARFDVFEVAVAEVAPEEIAGRADGGRGIVGLELGRHFAHGL